MKILGISDEVLTCGCCGKTNLKKTVVLGTDDGERYYGVNCAAMALMGNKKPGTTKAMSNQASAVALARKWLDKGHTPEVVAKGIWNRFGYLTEAKDGKVLIGDFAAVS